MMSSTGSRSAGLPLMARRISAVAVCCFRASLSERRKSAYDGSGSALFSARWSGVPHCAQNSAAASLFRWHRGHVMPGLPLAGATEGRNRGPRLTARDLHGQEDGTWVTRGDGESLPPLVLRVCPYSQPEARA